ncbi:MmcQ/YjbR family DNA-binding protein [Brevibacillus ruminantium]|uniref:MmcQ/YjbR family DNA-binding protein n=1 Tax=Brevibacillus ruminantium TaxID=2950604 RepID=A0ABY4WMV2_9BACL|nr:MmcQ/YjbR family DNA-binding protein [Brevibacillus ruminantium]USG68184.1 MmcQ/YjbR family DNA-binding protein [Brevibacillus ruminantium]
METKKGMQSIEGLELLDRIRGICTPFPEVVEKIDGFDHHSFRVSDKPFVILGENEAKAFLSIKSSLQTQELLLHKGGYTKTPYIGRHGWVTVSQSPSPDWHQIIDLIHEAYLRTAPKRLVKVYQEQKR